ncbi:hypothetical protein EV421DRAFT_1742862 [Armillaria borealis]|uniref:Uncharacterized protein n=1 Tax=Armillaria borealis TaxID=47425 RepID=A0AA39MFB1_9AGAR|nr:hypothetical protein EV421DRAFT_1742862 [Armillaria borealis]
MVQSNTRRAYEEKSKLNWEAWTGKIEALKQQKIEWKVEVKKKEKQKQAANLREKQEEKEAINAVAKKQLQKEKKEKKDKKKTVKSERKIAESDIRKKAVETTKATLIQEEQKTDGNTEGEISEASKEKVLQKLKEKHNRKQKTLELTVSTTGEDKKRKQPTKSISMLAESREEEVLEHSMKGLLQKAQL